VAHYRPDANPVPTPPAPKVIKLLSTPTGKAYLPLIAENQHDPDLAAALAERYIAARRTAATDVVERGIARSELRADLDPAAVIDLLYGRCTTDCCSATTRPNPTTATPSSSRHSKASHRRKQHPPRLARLPSRSPIPDWRGASGALNGRCADARRYAGCVHACHSPSAPA